MWCVMDGCNTAFSWETGRIETGRVHNPHYYEWLRRTGGGEAPREPGDIPCGGLPGAYQFIDTLEYAVGVPNTEIGRLAEIHRNLREMIDWRLRDYPARPPAVMNKDLDVRYLMNELTEDEWMRQLELAEARFRRKREIGQVLNMAATAGSDLLRTIVQRGAFAEADQFGDWLRDTAIREIDLLREFVNGALKELAKREHMAVPQLGADWRWIPIRALYKAPKKGKVATSAAATGVGLIGPTAADDVNEIVELLDEPEVIEIRD